LAISSDDDEFEAIPTNAAVESAKVVMANAKNGINQ
jgi:hypothetical protein